ncbi:MAG TPA: hypothetical protein VHB79_01020 [Polyangiaceae bacterium]|nr:hypothetical protein [Polyangiaceae bacterium]
MVPRLRTLIGSAATCLLLWSANADATLRVKTYSGGFTSSQTECDTLCTGGPLTGGLAGTLTWRMDTMEATSDPDVVKLTGVDTITTASGTLTIPDVTFWNLATGDFIDAGVITTGTGAFAGAHGTLVIQGAFDPAAGHGTSNYFAVVTLP